jgi:hypothetical protein
MVEEYIPVTDIEDAASEAAIVKLCCKYYLPLVAPSPVA